MEKNSTMLQVCAYMIVYVRDLTKCTTFYRDVLGMPMDDTIRGWTQFKSGDAALLLRSTIDGTTPLNGNAVHMTFQVDDLDDVCRKLSEQKVKFLAQPAAVDFGKQATICDPEDNPIDLIEWNLRTPGQVISDQTVVNDVLQRSPEAMEVLEEHGIRICGGCIVLLNGSVRETAEYSGLSATETSELVEDLNEKVTKPP